ncbi:hypothetical protein HUJ04_009297 [Dendroctonus ponderosae]|nr:hypothetical protein HUJ04_009297 [Dendroctonus ponderosae]
MCRLYTYSVLFLHNMKLKRPCKLCELSAEKEKILGLGCTHVAPSYLMGPFSPLMQPLGMGFNSGSFPPINMMLAAYLLKESYEEATETRFNHKEWIWSILVHIS